MRHLRGPWQGHPYRQRTSRYSGQAFLERRFLELRDGALKDGVGIGRLWRCETALDEAADSLGAARTIVLCGGPSVQSTQGFRL